jgi:hypothetical protein
VDGRRREQLWRWVSARAPDGVGWAGVVCAVAVAETVVDGAAITVRAVGVVAASLRIEPDDARDRLSAYSTRSGRSVLDVARAVTDRTLDPATEFAGT